MEQSKDCSRLKTEPYQIRLVPNLELTRDMFHSPTGRRSESSSHSEALKDRGLQLWVSFNKLLSSIVASTSRPVFQLDGDTGIYPSLPSWRSVIILIRVCGLC